MHFKRNKCPCTLGLKSHGCTRGRALSLTLSGFKGGTHGDRVVMKMQVSQTVQKAFFQFNG